MPISKLQLVLQTNFPGGTIKRKFFGKYQFDHPSNIMVELFVKMIDFSGEILLDQNIYTGNYVLVSAYRGDEKILNRLLYRPDEHSHRQIFNSTRLIVSKLHDEGWDVTETLKKWNLESPDSFNVNFQVFEWQEYGSDFERASGSYFDFIQLIDQCGLLPRPTTPRPDGSSSSCDIRWCKAFSISCMSCFTPKVQKYGGTFRLWRCAPVCCDRSMDKVELTA